VKPPGAVALCLAASAVAIGGCFSGNQGEEPPPPAAYAPGKPCDRHPGTAKPGRAAVLRTYQSSRTSRGEQIPFGVGGFDLPADPRAAQKFLPRNWPAWWFAIGSLSDFGEPIFIDTSEAGLPVCFVALEITDIPDVIADSPAGFESALGAFRELARGRGLIVSGKRNPVSPADRRAFLEEVAMANPGADLEFWKLQSTLPR
jgi:hypothetical protein